MNFHCITIAKPGQGTVNEDAATARETVVAVSDGAGGGGVFADLWAQYLLDKLPSQPLRSFNELDSWIDGIWELFFNDREHYAKLQDDGMLLEKFYNEGSFATLAAIWPADGEMLWTTYGDTVAFHYDFATSVLTSSLFHLTDFALPPYLISCKDPLLPEGFNCGTFEKNDTSVYFVTSDSLAHYILAMYMAEHRDRFESELAAAAAAHHRNAIPVREMLALPKVNFEKRLKKLLNIKRSGNFRQHIESLMAQHLIALDDYSIAAITL